MSTKRKSETSLSDTPRQIDIGDCIFSIPECASHLKISRAFLYKLIGDDKIKPVKIGARTLVQGAELRRFMNSLAA